MFTEHLNRLGGYSLGFMPAFFYLLWVAGRRSKEQEKSELSSFNKLYTDLNLLICFSLIETWGAFVLTIWKYQSSKYLFPVTLVIGAGSFFDQAF